MEGKRRDDVDVVDACFCRKVEYRFNNALANVGTRHFWKWQRDVVECNGEFHAREQKRWQWVHFNGVQQRMADSRIDVVNWCFWFRSVNDSRTVGWQFFK